MTHMQESSMSPTVTHVQESSMSPTMAHVQKSSMSSTVFNINGSRLGKKFPVAVEPGQQTTNRAPLPPFIGQIPHPGKMLIVCFDGTGNDFNADNSNIVQLVSMLKRDDKTTQMVYYQAGIGTYISPSAPVLSRIASKTYKILDQMLALSLDTHIMGGYEFLMQNYVVGDRICIFGFSRGSCTARGLSGMLHKVGLLPKDNHQQIPFAWKMYNRSDNWDESNAFRKSFSVEVPVEFLGVWDTVDSVGFIPRRLPFTTSNTIVRTFRHAVSLDERRSKFKIDLWKTATEDEEKLANQKPEHFQELQKQHEEDKKHSAHLVHEHSSTLSRTRLNINDYDTNSNDGGKGSDGGLQFHSEKRGSDFNGELVVLEDLKIEDQKMDYCEATYPDRYKGPTNVDEVWFAGCHGDVGGGYVPNGTRYCLARIPLRWMVRECFKTKSGIIFKTETLREVGIDPNTLYPDVHSRPAALFDKVKSQVIETPTSTSLFESIRNLFQSSEAKKKKAKAEEEKKKEPFISEEEEELRDSLSPKFDQLKLVRFWWILEVLPVSMTYQKTSNKRVSYIGINMGRARVIPQERTIKFHRSVKLRMDAQCRREGDKYEPRPDFRGVEPKLEWVD